MNKKALFVIPWLVGSGALFAAGEKSFSSSSELRFDLEMHNTNQKGLEDNEGKHRRFMLNRARFNLKGKITDGVSYRVRLRMDKSTDKKPSISVTCTPGATAADAPTCTAKTGGENAGVGPAADYAYITHKVNDMVSVTFGKLWTGVGGWNGNESGLDTYAYGGLWGHLVDNDIGVRADITSGDHMFQVVLGNGALETNQQGFNMALTYRGKLAGGMVRPVAFVMNKPATKSDGKGNIAAKKGYTDSDMGVGARIALDESFYFDFDYMMLKKDKRSDAEKVANSNAISLQAFYVQPTMKVKLKYATYTNFSNATGEKAATNTVMALAYEFYPVQDLNFNYHVAYASDTTKPEGGDSVTKSTIYLGSALSM